MWGCLSENSSSYFLLFDSASNHSSYSHCRLHRNISFPPQAN
nr:MAG TPA: hypothetical protein [Bacteriophage sp.]